MVGKFGNIPVPSKHGKEEMRLLAQRVRGALESGTGVIVFAEGHRTLDGRVHEFQKGIFRWACQWGVPIAPMSITGAFKFHRKGSWLLRPSTITVFLHEMIETRGLGPGDAEGLRQRVHAIVAAPVDAALGLATAPELHSYRDACHRGEVHADLNRTTSPLSQMDGVPG